MNNLSNYINCFKAIAVLICSSLFLTGCDDSYTKSGVNTLEDCQHELEEFHSYYYKNVTKVLTASTKVNTNICLEETKLNVLKNYQQKLLDCSFLVRVEASNKGKTTIITSIYDDLYLSVTRFVRTAESCNQASDANLLRLLKKQLTKNSDSIQIHLSKVHE